MSSEELMELSPSGRVRPWKEKKLLTKRVVDAYKKISKKRYYRNCIKKAELIENCGNVLTFGLMGDRKELIKANFCRIRTCPMCIWRRSLRLYGEMYKTIEYMEREKNSKFVFITLTQENCKFGKLRRIVDKMQSAFKQLMREKEFKSSCLGYVKIVEITVNPIRRDLHPHIHMIMSVPIEYGDIKYEGMYITKDRLIELWQKHMGLSYGPSVDIRRVQEIDGMPKPKAIGEISKYTFKDSVFDFVDILEKVLIEFESLKGLRVISFGGDIRKARRELGFTLREESENMVDVDCENVTEKQFESVVKYVWSNGYLGYFKSE